MSKDKKFKRYQLKIGEGQKLIQVHTDALNKHGELKGRNKKETKLLQATCCHHKLGKHGKIKMRVNPDQQAGMAHCTMCGHDFRIEPYTKEQRNEVINNFIELVDQTKYFAMASRVSEANIRQLAEASIVAEITRKINKKTTKAVVKQNNIDKKSRKNRSTSTLGNWRIGKR